eukprot:41852_1
MLFVTANKHRAMNNSANKRIITSRPSHKNTHGEFFTYTLPSTDDLSTNTDGNTLLTPVTPATNKPIALYQYTHEGKRENEDKHKLIHSEIKTEESKPKLPNQHQHDLLTYNNITSIAIGRNLSQETIYNSFIELICTTTTKQRQRIKRYYKQQYQFDMDVYINQNFKGIFKRILLYSMQNKMQRDLYILTIGVKKMKNINCILPLLCSNESDYINKLLNLYVPGMFEKTLREQIIKLTGKNALLRSFVVSILNGSRIRLPSRLLETDAVFLKDILLEKGELSTKDEIKLIDIFSCRSFEYLRALCASFISLTGISLMDGIKSKFGCKCKNNIGYAINCMLMYVLDAKEFYRKLL